MKNPIWQQMSWAALTPQQRLMLAGGLAAAFVLVETVIYSYVDKPLAFSVRELDQTAHGLIIFFRNITDYAKGAWYLWPTGLAVIFTFFLTRGKEVPIPYRRFFGYVGVRCLFVFSTVAISGIAINIIKGFVGRARPAVLFAEGRYGFEPFTFFNSLWNSMPSGHTTTAFAFACSMAILYPKLRALWFAFALVLSVSRVMVNAHYLSDVVAGAVCGALSVWAVSKYGIKPLSRIIFPIDNPSLK